MSKHGWDKKDLLIVGVLLVVALTTRFVELGYVPPGVRFDELVNVKMADHIYAGEWPIYFQEAWGHEALYHYFQALGMLVLGKTVLGVRIASLLFGVLGVLLTYLFVRRLSGRAVAAAAALLLAVSFWSLLYSHFGERHISLPVWLLLTGYCFWRGLEAPSGRRAPGIGWFAAGGLFAGLMFNTYFASRVVPVLFVGFIIYLLLFHRSMLRGRWPGLILFFLLPTLMVVPMTLYLWQHPWLEQRLGQVAGEMLEALAAGNLRPLWNAVVGTLAMFSFRGDPEWLYNISGRPVFDPLTSMSFYLGIGLSLWRWRDPRRFFVLLWLAVGLIPSLVSWPAGSLGHTIVAQPAAFALAALGLISAVRWLAQRTPSRTHTRGRWGTWAGRALAVLTILIFASLNLYDYLVRWPRFPEVLHEYQAPITAVARYLRENPEQTPACVSAPYVDYWNPWSKMNHDLYATDDERVRWFDGTQSLLLPESGHATIVLPDHILLPLGLAPDLDTLLQASAQPVALNVTDRLGARFDVYEWTDRGPLTQRLAAAAAAPAWASAETVYESGTSDSHRRPLEMPLDFQRLALLGYTYEQERAQPGQVWRMTTYWQVREDGADPLALFVHVLDADNQVRAGWDGLYVSQETWQAGDLLIHVHTLTLPSELSAGMQRVEVGVYSPVTQQRLALSVEGQGPAPYDRALLQPLTVER